MLASCCPSKKGGELDNMNNDVHPGAVKYPSVQPSRSMGDWIIIGFMFIVVVLFLAFCIRVSTVATQSDENVPKITQKYMPAIKSNILDKPVTGVPSNANRDDLLVSGLIRQEDQPIPPAIEKMIAEYAAAGPFHAEWRGMHLSLVFDSPKDLDGKDWGTYEFLIDEDLHDRCQYFLDMNKGEVNFYMSEAKEWKTLTVNFIRTSKPKVKIATETISIPNLRESLRTTIRKQFKLPDLYFPPKDRGQEGDEKYFEITYETIALTRHYCGNCKLVHLDGSPRNRPGDRKIDEAWDFSAAVLDYNKETNMWDWCPIHDLKLVPQ
eukprot:811008_1